MHQCITASTRLNVATLEVGSDFVYIVVVDATHSTIRVTFDSTANPAGSGSISGVSVSPSGPSHGTNWVEFSVSDPQVEYTVTITYVDPPTSESRVVPPLETLTKTPKFKPLSSCPPSSA